MKHLTNKELHSDAVNRARERRRYPRRAKRGASGRVKVPAW